MCWITLMSALLTPVVSIVAAIILYLQLSTYRRIQKTDEKRLKHERYEKRFAVYDAARTFLRNIMIHEKDIKDAMVMEYWSGINPSRFLLDEEITAYLEEIEHVVARFRETGKVPDSQGVRTWAESQVPILNNRFYPYLYLGD